MRKRLREIFLDWVNNYITVDKMCIDYGVSKNRMYRIIGLGRILHEQHVKRLKSEQI